MSKQIYWTHLQFKKIEKEKTIWMSEAEAVQISLKNKVIWKFSEIFAKKVIFHLIVSSRKMTQKHWARLEVAKMKWKKDFFFTSAALTQFINQVDSRWQSKYIWQLRNEKVEFFFSRNIHPIELFLLMNFE